MMKYIVLILIITLTHITVNGQQQKINNNYQKSYIDSAIFYFNKAKTPNGIDSLAFKKGLDIISKIAIDDNAIKRIQNTSKEFIGIEKSRFYTTIEITLYNAIVSSHQYYKAIDFGKAIISRYQATQNADERNLFLSMLSNMRIPFRLSDKLEDGFDFYTAQLKLYLQKNDSTAISVCYYVHGGFYATKGLNDLSIYYYKKSILYLNENDTVDSNARELYSTGRSAWVNNTAVVGKIYNDLGDYHNAILYSRAALKFGVKNEIVKLHRSYIHKNIAYAKIMLNELDSVIYYLNIAITEAKSSKQQVANCYLVKGVYYMHSNQLDSSEFYLNQCSNLIEENNMPANSTDGKLVPNYYRALCRIKQNRFKDAADLLITEISRLGNLRQDLINEYSLLVEVYLKLGDVKNATETFALYSTLQEQLKADERNNSKMSFETELKIASAEGMIKDLETEKNVASITRNYLTGISLLLLVLVLIVFNRFRIKKRANLALEEKNRIISIEKANVEKEKVRAENALTDLKSAQKQLVKSEKMAAFGVMASRVSHEILNPLNFVNNFSELAQETVTDVINSESIEDKKENADILISNLQKINEHGKRATVIVKQLQEHSSKGTAQEFFETE